jgi:hypothetical protein
MSPSFDDHSTHWECHFLAECLPSQGWSIINIVPKVYSNWQAPGCGDQAEFGAYVQTHEQHTNDMQPWTIGAICLGPSGNEQGGHYFMSLMTGQCLHQDHWMDSPMPANAIDQVNMLAWNQVMPKTLTFADHLSFEAAR